MFFNSKTKNKNKRNFRLSSESGAGFTMIELVIALFVLTVAVIGAYNAFSIMVVATAQMSDRFTAAYLAEEGIEIVRNMRDNNWLDADQDPEDPAITWDRGLTSCDTGCEADYKTGTSSGIELTPYSSGGRNLYIDSNKFYSYAQIGVETKFRRKITIYPVDDHTLRVTATVFWDEKRNIVNIDFPGETGSITAEDYLYNWY